MVLIILTLQKPEKIKFLLQEHMGAQYFKN